MLRNLQILQIYRLTDLYDFRSPGAHPRTRTVYNTKHCGEAGALHQFVPTRARAREWRGGDTVVSRGGGACEIRCGGAGLRSCWGGRMCCTSSSGVLPVGWSAAGLRSCWEAGPRARAHAESRIDFGTKSAYFWRQSGCTARIRKAWRWRGSAESPACGSAGSSTHGSEASAFPDS